MNFLSDIHPHAVLIATVAYLIIGFLWYTKLFGVTWRAENGMPAATAADKPAVAALLGQFISTLLFTLGIAILLKLLGIPGIVGAIHAAVLVTVFFAIPINSGNLFFTGKRRLFFIDVAERAVGALVVGVILGLWH